MGCWGRESCHHLEVQGNPSFLSFIGKNNELQKVLLVCILHSKSVIRTHRVNGCIVKFNESRIVLYKCRPFTSLTRKKRITTDVTRLARNFWWLSSIVKDLDFSVRQLLCIYSLDFVQNTIWMSLMADTVTFEEWQMMYFEHFC